MIAYQRLSATTALLLALAVAAGPAPPSAALSGTGQPGQSIDAAPVEAIAASIDGGGSHTCGIRANGTAVCWGDNTYGKATAPAGTFTAITAGQSDPPAGTFTQLSSRSNHSCAVDSTGFVACWGAGGFSKALPPSGRFRTVSVGNNHTCGFRVTGVVACWGRNHVGQLTVPPWFG